MTDEPDIAALVTELAARVSRLEREPGGHRGPITPIDLVGTPSSEGRVAYGGNGPWDGRNVAWQVERAWADVVPLAGEQVARVLSALASGVRLRIVAELTAGTLTTGDLSERLGQASSGQLFHHLRELMAAGIVHQPARGTYALRPQHVLPMLAVLSAAADLASGDANEVAEVDA